MIVTHGSRRKLGFIRQDLVDLPNDFPACVIREGKITRADGLPLKWEQYDLLREDFTVDFRGTYLTAEPGI